MRIEYKESISEKLHRLYHELQMVNKFHLVDAVYLSNVEWDEFRYSLPYFTEYKQVAIHQPLRFDYSYEYKHLNTRPTVIKTEEIEYHGFKVRREYRKEFV